MVRVRAMRTIENSLGRLGFNRVAGVDEVGRGCLAGPVMAGAVVLDPCRHIPGLADSKLLTAAERDRLYAEIVDRAAGWAVGVVGVDEIDRLNIHRATLLHRCEGDPRPPDDGAARVRLPLRIRPSQGLRHG
jgi:ribonuclease HII